MGSRLADLVPAMLACQCTARAAHWAATSYAAHAALDGLCRELDAAGDVLVEAARQGASRGGRAAPRAGLSIRVPPAALAGDAEGAIAWVAAALRGVRARVPPRSPELLQPLDDMLLACARAAYLARMAGAVQDRVPVARGVQRGKRG